jgi:hypothetical protein
MTLKAVYEFESILLAEHMRTQRYICGELPTKLREP